jgi:hypothetical protein
LLDRVIAWFRRKGKERKDALAFERQIIVRMDERGISALYPGGTVRPIAWSEVERIAIVTNDSGPWGSDVWWVLEGADNRCAYPQGASGDEAALAEMQRRFEGFNNAAVIEAMGSTSNASFVCWQKSSTPDRSTT